MNVIWYSVLRRPRNLNWCDVSGNRVFAGEALRPSEL
jgi:hypothetical protein